MGLADLTFRGKPDALCREPNIAKGMDEADRALIGQYCKSGYDEDKQSRAAWESTYAKVLELALQVMREKTYPWPNCSNVKFPLLTISALSFHSKAYPALVPAQGAVHCTPVGIDPSDKEIDRCSRIAGHMSYQLQECTNWEAETDKALIALPILGTVFKKTYYDPVTKQRRSDLVLPQNLIVHYYTSDLARAQRVSEFFQRTKNEVYELEAQGLWIKGSANPPLRSPGPLEASRDKAQGVNPPVPPLSNTIFDLIEQQALLDLDGDGYDEPYTVTFESQTGVVRRIVARYMPGDVTYKPNSKTVMRIEAEQCYTKFPFIPSPDGGFYDLGFGGLIGPLNASVDSLINQLIDAGSMATLGGGLLGRGVRIKKGTSTFMPQEWKTVDSTGDDLNKNIVPLPVREPSKTLLELLTFLVDYAARISSANEIQLGEALGQNAKAGVVETLNENGARTFGAIFKRIHRATKEEFRKFYTLNKRYPIEEAYQQAGKWFQVTQNDYTGTDYGVVPSSDPNIVTDSQKRSQASLVMQTAQAVPGHNLDAVVRRYYKAFGVTDIDTIFPGAGKPGATPPGPDAKLLAVQIKAQEAETKRLTVMTDLKERQIKILLEVQKIQAEIVKLYAEAAQAEANAAAEGSYAKAAEINSIIAAKKTHQEGVLALLELVKDVATESKTGESNGRPSESSGTSAGGTGSDGLSEMAGLAGNPGAMGALSAPIAGNGTAVLQ